MSTFLEIIIADISGNDNCYHFGKIVIPEVRLLTILEITFVNILEVIIDNMIENIVAIS